MKRLIFLLLILTACVARPQFNCEIPEGRSYDCYSDEQCKEFMSGYSCMISHRYEMQDKYGWFPGSHQEIYVNLWCDHKDMLILGKIETDRKEDGRIYMKMWTEVYDLNCNLLDSGYKEGYRIKKK
jgi:hypothetical protein